MKSKSPTSRPSQPDSAQQKDYKCLAFYTYDPGQRKCKEIEIENDDKYYVHHDYGKWSHKLNDKKDEKSRYKFGDIEVTREKDPLGKGGGKKVYVAKDIKSGESFALLKVNTENFCHISSSITLTNQLDGMGRGFLYYGKRPENTTDTSIPESIIPKKISKAAILMPLYTGCNLYEFKKNEQHTQLECLDIALIALQMIEALQAFHNLGWAHCDIKLDQFVYDIESNQVKLIDYELARKIPEGEETVNYEFREGTPAFMPNETFGAELDKVFTYGYPCDIYSLALSIADLFGLLEFYYYYTILTTTVWRSRLCDKKTLKKKAVNKLVREIHKALQSMLHENWEQRATLNNVKKSFKKILKDNINPKYKAIIDIISGINNISIDNDSKTFANNQEYNKCYQQLLGLKNKIYRQKLSKIDESFYEEVLDEYKKIIESNCDFANNFNLPDPPFPNTNHIAIHHLRVFTASVLKQLQETKQGKHDKELEPIISECSNLKAELESIQHAKFNQEHFTKTLNRLNTIHNDLITLAKNNSTTDYVFAAASDLGFFSEHPHSFMKKRDLIEIAENIKSTINAINSNYQISPREIARIINSAIKVIKEKDNRQELIKQYFFPLIHEAIKHPNYKFIAKTMENHVKTMEQFIKDPENFEKSMQLIENFFSLEHSKKSLKLYSFIGKIESNLKAYSTADKNIKENLDSIIQNCQTTQSDIFDSMKEKFNDDSWKKSLQAIHSIGEAIDNNLPKHNSLFKKIKQQIMDFIRNAFCEAGFFKKNLKKFSTHFVMQEQKKAINHFQNTINEQSSKEASLRFRK